MGRRALRKIDPALDLAGYFLEWDDLPRPFSPQRLFQRSAPLEIEVGSGKGLFVDNASAAHPERDYLGIERARKYARYAAARLARHARANAKLLCADALRVFAELIPDGAVSAVHIYFPDPWWKKRHKKRRVMVASFVADIERALVPGGALHFWTDVEEYFQTSLELLSTATTLTGPLPVAEQVAEHHLDYRTHFERRTRLHEQPVYRAEFRRV
jgi:tRNA (guanine-N7-)-methyltransferase